MNLTDLTICYKCHSLFKMLLILFIYLVGLFFGTQNIPLIFQSSFLGFLIFIYYIKLIFSQYFYFLKTLDSAKFLHRFDNLGCNAM